MENIPCELERYLPNTPSIDLENLFPSHNEMWRIFCDKYLKNNKLSWGPKLRIRSGYFSPDDYYECVVKRIVEQGSRWADVGCGRNIFPHNVRLAGELAKRASFVLGIDPDETVKENRFISERFQGFVEDTPSEYSDFDVVTLRMVAEHIANPDAAIGRVSQLIRVGGYVVIYTPNKWSPMSLAAAATPFQIHHPIKKILWNTEQKDTFPTEFKLNTRKDLRKFCSLAGLEEVMFVFLDDCRTTSKFRVLNYLELLVRRGFCSFRIPYPENCILGVYKKTQ